MLLDMHLSDLRLYCDTYLSFMIVILNRTIIKISSIMVDIWTDGTAYVDGYFK